MEATPLNRRVGENATHCLPLSCLEVYHKRVLVRRPRQLGDNCSEYLPVQQRVPNSSDWWSYGWCRSVNYLLYLLILCRDIMKMMITL